MRFTGRLQDWNEQRGFGFIRPAAGGDDLFVHASALPSPRPGLQEALSFEVAVDARGRKKATRVRRQSDEAAALQADRAREGQRLGKPQGAPPRPRGTRRLAPTLALVAMIAVLGWSGYERYVQRMGPRPFESASRPAAARPVSTPVFSCDGRTQCSQMRSCEEATFFLRNCPGTKMDGDGDGVPCEQQLCSSGGR